MNVEQITAEIQENGVALLKADESVSKLLLSHGNVVRSRSPREKVKASASKLSQARQSLTALKQAGVQLDKDRTKAVRDAETARKARAEAYVDDRMPDAIERLRQCAAELLALGQISGTKVDVCGSLTGIDYSAELSKMENEIGSN